jgi:hypothetical protein
MSDDAIIAALKKRHDLETRIAKTEQRIKSFKAQVAEINAFIGQWERFSGRNAPTLQLTNLSQNETDSEDAVHGNLPKEEVARLARFILLEANEPMSRGELYKRLVKEGARINGKNPEMVLSTMLWRAGKDVGIVRLKTGGYTLKERARAEDQEIDLLS